MQDKKVINTFAITTKQGVIRNINHSTIMQPKTQFSGNPMNWFDDNKLLKKKENGGLRNMEFAKIYDAKINEELKKYEKLQWEMYYRTLLPERMQQFEQEYIGNSKDKEQAMKQHKAELMAKHAGRIQRLLNQKRERLTVECLGELIDRLETAEYEADQKDNEFNPEDYEELPVDETSSCEDEASTLASEIIADQEAEIEKLKEELRRRKTENPDRIDRHKEDLFIRFQDYTTKLQYMLNSTIDRYNFDEGAITDKETALIFGYNREHIWTELEIALDYIFEIEKIRKELESLN